MSTHAAFVAFSYGVTLLVIAAMIGAILMDYRRLKRALSRFPQREGEEI